MSDSASWHAAEKDFLMSLLRVPVSGLPLDEH